MRTGTFHGRRRPPRRLLAAGLVLLLAACASQLSLGEYAARVDVLIDDMNGRLDRLYAAAEQSPSLETTRRYMADRVQARYDFIAALEEMEPPDDIVELHTTALGILRRLADAEARLAARVATMETNLGIDAIWQTPEGLAAQAVDSEAVGLCLAAQSELDRTEARRELGDVPWVPPQMKEVVIVTFGCRGVDR